MRRRKDPAKGVEALRDEAISVRQAAEKKARLVLEQALDAEARLETEADDLELSERVAARRAEIKASAAEASTAALRARAVADQAAAEADDHAARRAELHSSLVEGEMRRRLLLAEVEAATARGDLEQALELEARLGEFDIEPLRVEVSRAAAAEQDASDRAGQAYSEAEQRAAEAAELRQDFEAVEDELRAEYEIRGGQRLRQIMTALDVFDNRWFAYMAAMEAGISELATDVPKAVDSANRVDRPFTVYKDADGKLVGFELPLERVG